MKEVFRRLTKTDGGEVEHFAFTYATAEACMFLPKHLQNFESNADNLCFLNHLLVWWSCFQGRFQAKIRTKQEQFVQYVPVVLLFAIDGTNEQRIIMAWDALLACVPTQKFPEHIIYFMSIIFKDPSLSKIVNVISLLNWAECWN